MLFKREEIFVLLQLVCAIESQLKSYCKEDFDCNKPIKCAYCNRGKCEIIDKNIFTNDSLCKYRQHGYVDTERYCDPDRTDYTNVYGTEGYGESVCICNTVPVYGSRCIDHIYFTSSVLNSFHWTPFPTGILFITPSHVKFNRPAPILGVCSQKPPFPLLIVHDLTGGYVARIENPTFRGKTWSHGDCIQFAKTEKLLLEDMCSRIHWEECNMVLVARFSIPFDLTTRPGEKITSFTRAIQIDAYHPWDNAMWLSSHSHNYYVNYPKQVKFTVTPVIRITGCGNTLVTKKKYGINEEIHLTANYFYVDTDSYSLSTRPRLAEIQQLEFKWEAYKLKGDTNEYKEVNDFKIGSLSWDIPSHHWIGYYVVNLTVTGYFQSSKEHIKLRTKRDSNFNICIIEVSLVDLKAVIAGGQAKFVFREQSLTLDASKSRNPNSPDGKSGMQFTFTCNWTQEAVCSPHVIGSEHYEPYIIPPMVLQSNKAYNFTLKVVAEAEPSLRPAFANQIIVVGDLGATHFLDDFHLDCIYNCEPKTNPKDIVCLRVGGPWTQVDSLLFEWVQYEVSEQGVKLTEETSIDSIRQSDTPSFILIINEDTLKENTMYEFKVSYKKSSKFVTYPIKTTFSPPHTCRIYPESGETGLTKFKLSCMMNSSSQVVEFYDKNEADGPDFSGRMLGSQETGDIEEFFLTRGRLEILSFDEYGMVTTIVLNVTLSKSSRSTADVKQILDDLMKHSDVQSVGESLHRASLVSDLLTSAQDKEISGINILETVVRFLNTLSIKRFKEAKLGISTLHIALLAARGSLSLDSALHTARTIHTLAQTLDVGLKSGLHCTFRVLYQIFSRILDCMYIVSEVKENYLSNAKLPVQYNPVIYKIVKEISQCVLKSFVFLKSALSYRQLPAQKQKLIESSLGSLSMWIKVDIPRALSKYTQDEHRKNLFPVIVPDKLAKDVRKMGFYLALQYVSFRQNPSWLAGINTRDRYDVSVCFKGNDVKTCNYQNFLKNGVQVVFNISDVISKVEFQKLKLKRLDGSLETEWLDINLPVYKLDPLPLAFVEAHFRFNDSNTELLVLVEKDIRPTYEQLIIEERKVTSKSPVYPVVTDPSNKLHLYYLAIQPGAQVQTNGTVSFDLKIYSKMCYSWHKRWTTQGCHSMKYPDTNTLICECNRLSLIGGLVKEVMYSLEVVGEFPLSLTISGANAARVLSISLLILTFLFLALICIKTDR